MLPDILCITNLCEQLLENLTGVKGNECVANDESHVVDGRRMGPVRVVYGRECEVVCLTRGQIWP